MEHAYFKLLHMLSGHPGWALAVVALAALLESVAFIGTFVPGSTAMFVAGALVGGVVGSEVGKKVGGKILDTIGGKGKNDSSNTNARTDVTAELERLAKLHKQGVLDDAEFKAAKASLLNL